MHYLQQLRQTTTFYCPQCQSQIILKIGRVKIPHFAHKRNDACQSAFSEGESAIHLLGKQQLYDFFSTRVDSVALESYIPQLQQRPDLLVTKEKQSYAVEFQCSVIPSELLQSRTDGYVSQSIRPLWLAKTPDKTSKFGLSKISISHFYEQFLSYEQKQPFLITYDPSMKRFIYYNQLIYVQGRTWLANVQPLSLDNQHFPFLQPRPLTNLQFEQMMLLYQAHRQQFFRAKFLYNRQGVQQLFLRGLYEQKLTYAQLPNYIGIPLLSNESIPLFSAEWQSNLFYFLAIFQCTVSDMTPQKIEAFIRWSRLPNTAAVKKSIEFYILFLSKLRIESITQKVDDTTLFRYLFSELIAFSEKN